MRRTRSARGKLATSAIALAVARGALAAVRRRRAVGLVGATAVVCGASRGLGRAIALELARRGVRRIAICSRTESDLDEVAAQLVHAGVHVCAEGCDLTSEEETERFIGSASARLGPIDILVTNAATLTVGPAAGWTREDYDEAIRLNPRDATALAARGNAYLSKAEYDHAIADYDAAIRIDAGLALAYNDRGFGYIFKGEYDKAIADFDQAIRLKTDFVNPRAGRGYALHKRGDADAALADLNAAIGSPELRALAGEFVDAFAAVGIPPDDPQRRSCGPLPIDHILVRRLVVDACRVVTEAGDASDHLPVVATLRAEVG